jgi:hypothetical protein
MSTHTKKDTRSEYDAHRELKLQISQESHNGLGDYCEMNARRVNKRAKKVTQWFVDTPAMRRF